MNSLKRFTNSAQEIRLTDEERSAIRENLIAFMEENPAKAPLILSPYERFIGILSPLAGSAMRTPVLALALLIIIGVGSGTALAAEGALPGDALYPVKVGLIEPLKGSLAVSDEAKAEWDTHLAETRLSEAETLAVRSDLTEATQAKLAASFNASVTAANGDIDNIEKKNPVAAADLKLALNLSLTSHGQALANLIGDASSPNAPAVLALAETVGSSVSDDNAKRPSVMSTFSAKSSEVIKTPEGKTAPKTFAKSFAAKSASVLGVSTTTDASTTEESAYSEKASRALDALSMLRSAFAASRNTLTASTTADIDATIKAADENIATGKAKLGGKDAGDADEYFIKAWVLTQKSKLLLQLATSTYRLYHPDDSTKIDLNQSSEASPPAVISPVPTSPPSTSGSSVSGSGSVSAGASSGSSGGSGPVSGVVHSVTSGLGL